VLAFRRVPGFACVVNLGDTPADLPEELGRDGSVATLASGQVEPGRGIPGATAVWYSRG
jgi:alpha-glucosidase